MLARGFTAGDMDQDKLYEHVRHIVLESERVIQVEETQAPEKVSSATIFDGIPSSDKSGESPDMTDTRTVMEPRETKPHRHQSFKDDEGHVWSLADPRYLAKTGKNQDRDTQARNGCYILRNGAPIYSVKGRGVTSFPKAIAFVKDTAGKWKYLSHTKNDTTYTGCIKRLGVDWSTSTGGIPQL